MAKTLIEFVNTYRGLKVGTGQCVALVQQYCIDCLEIGNPPKEHAKDWTDALVKQGIATEVDTPQAGDIIVTPTKGDIGGVIYGHIGIFIGNFNGNNNMMFEQNYGNEGDPLKETARVARNFNSFITKKENNKDVLVEYHILRPKKNATEEPKPLEGIYLRSVKTPFRVRKSPVTGNQIDLILVDRQVPILQFLSGFQSDGYQWAKVQASNGEVGYSQLDLKDDYRIACDSKHSLFYMRAVKDAFRIRETPVTGSYNSNATVPIGGRAEILDVQTSHASDGYQWAYVQNGSYKGYSQMDTFGYYQLESE